jgi:hypothetical protein
MQLTCMCVLTNEVTSRFNVINSYQTVGTDDKIVHRDSGSM